ncbi:MULTISPECIES: thermonuclease family protein [Shewanella]|nr:thermonuclease family protein [Shewanella xiamenensis]MCT8877499.1 thermonuclease family protein [Shewanella xiamenensis]
MRYISLLAISILFMITGAHAVDSGIITVKKVVSVYDGDTFRAILPNETKDQKIRVRGVDTPEIKGQCSYEKDAALRARDFTKSLLMNAKVIQLSDVGEEKYHRVLAKVTIDGVDLANTLISEGLGRQWKGRRESWCVPVTH